MNSNSFALLLLAASLGCNGSRSQNQNPVVANTGSQSECGNGPCEHVAYMKKFPLPGEGPGEFGTVKLSRSEQASLSAAFAGAGSSTHLRADVVRGELVFVPDTAAQPSGKEPDISLTNGGPSKKVMASEAAVRLLKKRMVP
jgi:hypothetical protein